MLVDSPLESKRFNIRACKLQISDASEIIDDLQMASKMDYNFISCRVPSGQLDLAQGLELQGFLIMDTLVYYKSPVPSEVLSLDWESCISNEAWIKEVCGIAELAFKNYPSHYSMDHKLDQKAAGQVYEDWALRSCRDRSVATDVLVKTVGGKVVAFTSVKDHATHGEVMLAAVHPDFQGQGILQNLLASAVSWAQKQGHKEIFYSTQLQNISAQKALTRQGWEISHSFTTFHKWLE